MPQNHIKISIILLTVSIMIEITLLAGIFSVGSQFYHALHILFMAALVGSQLCLFFTNKTQAATRRLALWFAVGTSLTAVGDFINSANSHVQPVSLKLTWALALFGAGYTIYVLNLWNYNNKLLKNTASSFARLRYLVAVPILAVNVISWLLHVAGNLQGHNVLYYGSFIFNATIYVMMPTAAVWYFFNSKQSIGGLIVLCGAVLIPYSDLVLFGSWLRGGDPAVPSFQLYAYNWILYFAGQVLISMFPALAMTADGVAQAGCVKLKIASSLPV